MAELMYPTLGPTLSGTRPSLKSAGLQAQNIRNSLHDSKQKNISLNKASPSPPYLRPQPRPPPQPQLRTPTAQFSPPPTHAPGKTPQTSRHTGCRITNRIGRSKVKRGQVQGMSWWAVRWQIARSTAMGRRWGMASTAQRQGWEFGGAMRLEHRQSHSEAWELRLGGCCTLSRLTHV